MLGVDYDITNNGNITDINVIKTSERGVTSNSCTGAPLTKYGFFICKRYGNYAQQIWTDLDGKRSFIRSANVGVSDFTNIGWVEIYTTDLLTNSSLLSPLASALGGTVTSIYTNDNLDNFTNVGIYRCSSNSVASSLSNCPVNMAFIIRTGALSSPQRKIQELYTIDDQYWVRNFDGGTTWSAWVRNDNYGTSSLSELASALGGLLLNDNEISDFNNVLNTCGLEFVAMTADSNNHAPATGILRGFLYAVRSNAANYGFQIWFGTSDGIFTMKARAWILNVGWENWKQVTIA